MAEALVAVLLAATAVLGLAIWSIKRHKDPHLELTVEAWRARGVWARLRESALYVFNEVL